MVVRAKPAGLSILEIADLLGLSETEWSGKHCGSSVDRNGLLMRDVRRE